LLSCKVGSEQINVVDYEEKQLRKWSRKKILKCPVCGGVLVYKRGLIKIPHFAHKKDSDCIYTFYENETKEHAIGKTLIYKWLKKLPNVKNLKLEAWISQTKQRPDLYFEIDDKKHVIEYQCSPITLKEYLERKELYKLNNIMDIWICGTENFNFKLNGRLKMKALDKQLFLSSSLYYINPFEEVIYSVYARSDYVVDFYKIRQQKFSDLNNFYVEEGKIFLSQTINDNFVIRLKNFITDIKNKEEREKCELLQQQKKIYNFIKKQFEIEEARKKVNNIIENKDIYIYNSYNQIKKDKYRNKFYFIVYKGYQISAYWLYETINKFNEKIKFQNNIYILIKCDFTKKAKDFLTNYFPENKVIFVDGEVV
jgi:competence CoiA-like predicted nuclease